MCVCVCVCVYVCVCVLFSFFDHGIRKEAMIEHWGVDIKRDAPGPPQLPNCTLSQEAHPPSYALEQGHNPWRFRDDPAGLGGLQNTPSPGHLLPKGLFSGP